MEEPDQMRPRQHVRATAATALITILTVLALAAPVAAADPVATARDKTIAYWTPERIAHATPRDFVRGTDGTFRPAAKGGPASPNGKPSKPGGGSGNNVIGASWTAGKQILTTSGKVVFTMNSGDYICSGTVVKDNRAAYSIVLTAGHCAYDAADGGFARNWMFIPEFDSAPTYTCSAAKWGCWNASALIVDTGFANSGGFNTQATVHDWSFAVVGAGGKGNTQLDTTVGTFNLSTTNLSLGGQVFSFGYPAAGKYHGSDLTYCSDQVFTDARNANLTWGIDCNMTGGSSGGPWLTNFDSTTGVGILSSVNSYGYGNTAQMYGPKFNNNTQTTFNAAQNATTSNVTVSVPN
jgi:V8-like Glu-specific endopeptidase